MSEITAGDRVRLTHYPEQGTGVVTDVADTIAVKWDSGAEGYFLNENIHNELTRIAEPQPWQGECFGCHTPLTPETACFYNGFLTHRCYLCPMCWAYESDNDNSTLGQEQKAALASSRAWMHERYPDDPRWQEAER